MAFQLVLVDDQGEATLLQAQSALLFLEDDSGTIGVDAVDAATLLLANEVLLPHADRDGQPSRRFRYRLSTLSDGELVAVSGRVDQSLEGGGVFRGYRASAECLTVSGSLFEPLLVSTDPVAMNLA